MPYWDDRRKALDAELAKNEKQLFQRMQRFYSTEAARLDKEIAAYYARYGENNVISYRRLMEQLSDADRQLLIERMEDFAKAYPQYAHLLPVRESIYKLNRLEGLRTSIAVQQLQISAREQAEARAFFEQLALRYANAAAKQMGFGSSFYRLDHEMLRLVVGNNWCNGKDFSERIWDNRTALTQSLQNEVTNCFIRGDDLKKTSRILQQKFVNVSQKNIERLVFTENSYLANEASIRVFEQEANIRSYQFLATADARTCEICNELNEQVFRISERSAGVNFPPMHPWCRCFAIPVWDESGRRGLTSIELRDTIESRDGEKMLRKAKTGKIEPMPKKQFQRIVKRFKAQGGLIQFDDETDAYLMSKNAEAITYNANTILIRQNPGRASVFEELIHTAQYRKGENDGSYASRLRCEIAAQEKLLKYAEAYKLTEPEIVQTRKALEAYQRELSEYLINGGVLSC